MRKMGRIIWHNLAQCFMRTHSPKAPSSKSIIRFKSHCTTFLEPYTLYTPRKTNLITSNTSRDNTRHVTCQAAIKTGSTNTSHYLTRGTIIVFLLSIATICCQLFHFICHPSNRDDLIENIVNSFVYIYNTESWSEGWAVEHFFFNSLFPLHFLPDVFTTAPHSPLRTQMHANGLLLLCLSTGIINTSGEEKSIQHPARIPFLCVVPS